MKVITSQSYINYDIVDEKIAALDGTTEITLTVWTTGLVDENGEELCILSDGHHTYEAAMELGVEVSFDEVEHPEGLTGDKLLEAAWMDSDYHYLGTEINVW